MMYQSPIELFNTDPMVETLKNETDALIVRAVAHADVKVDRDELIKALQYDREQYEKGFSDGVLYEQERLEGAIRKAIDALEKLAGMLS